MFLVDTNIFLEILLEQEKKEDCKKFLNDNVGNLHITDFSLHSVGVILLKYKKRDVFLKFINDTIPNVRLLTLPLNRYKEIINFNNLDFDDAYQYSVAKYYELKIATMDKDFEKIKDENILFL